MPGRSPFLFVIAALFLAGCDTDGKVLGSIANPMPPSTGQPLTPARAQGMARRLIPPAPPNAANTPADYPVGRYGFDVGDVLPNYPFNTRDNLSFTPDDIRKMEAVGVIVLVQTTEGCCPIVGRLDELRDQLDSQRLFLLQLVTHDRAGQRAKAQTLIDWDRETGFQGLSVFGGRMFGHRGVLDTPALVVVHARTMKVQAFVSGAAVGGLEEIGAAVEAALATAP